MSGRGSGLKKEHVELAKALGIPQMKETLRHSSVKKVDRAHSPLRPESRASSMAQNPEFYQDFMKDKQKVMKAVNKRLDTNNAYLWRTAHNNTEAPTHLAQR